MQFILRDCFFFESSTLYVGAALTVANTATGDPSVYSNTKFEECTATTAYSGCVLCTRSCFATSFSSLSFVECGIEATRDIYVDSPQLSALFDETNVIDCQSTRDTKKLQRGSNSDTTHDHLVKTVVDETIVTKFEGTDNGDGTATFTLEVDDGMDGEAIVLVENLGSTRSPSPPTIPRILRFSFATGSKTSTCSIPIGDNGLLQTPISSYELRRVGMPGWIVRCIRVTSVSCPFNDATETTAAPTFTFEGLPQSGYSLLVKSGSTQKNMSLSVGSDGTSLVASGQMYPTTGAVLTFNTEYSVIGFRNVWGKAILLPAAQKFTTPAEPARVVIVQNTGLDSTGENIVLIFHARQMPAGTYACVLDQNSISFDVIFAEADDEQALIQRQSKPVALRLYGTGKKLTFNTFYSLKSVTHQATSASVHIVSGTTQFSTPVEPARITGITNVEYDSKFTTISLTFSGIRCQNLEHTLTLKNLDTDATTNITASFTSPTIGNSTTAIWNTQGTSTLKQGTKYEIVGAKTPNTIVYFHTGLIINVISPRHRIVSFGSFTHGGDLNTTTVKVVGHSMTPGVYPVKFLDSTLREISGKITYVDADITFTTASAGTMTIALYPTLQMLYGHQYLLSTITHPSSATEQIIDHTSSLTMPTEPARVTKIEFDKQVLDETGEHVLLLVTARQMPAGTYTIELNQNSISFDVVFPEAVNDQSFVERHSELVSVRIYGTDKKLSFGTSYTVKSVTHQTTLVSVLINYEQTAFTTPVEPARITSIADWEYIDKFTTIKLHLNGINCHTNLHYTLTLKNLATEALSTGYAMFESPSTGQSSMIIWNSLGTSTLTQGAKYEIVGVSATGVSVFVAPGLQFTVISPRSRLSTFGELSYSKDMNKTTIPVTGEHIIPATYTISFIDFTHFQETQESINAFADVKFTSDTAGSMTVELYPNAQMVFGHQYLPFAVTKPDSVTEEVYNNLGFLTIQPEPARLTNLVTEYSNQEKTITLTWEGKKMTEGPFVVTLSVNGTGTTTISASFDAAGTTGTTTETLFGSESPRLKYSTTYVVTGVTDSSSTPVFFNTKLNFTITPEPSRLLLISGPKDGGDLNSTTLHLSGHRIPSGDASLTVVLDSVIAGTEQESDKIILPSSFTVLGETSTGTSLISLYPTASLVYSQKYRILSLSSAAYLDKLLCFTTPNEPARIVKITPSGFDKTGEHLKLTVRARQMPAGTYSVVLDQNSISFDVTFAEATDEQAFQERDSDIVSIRIYGEDGKLTFDTEYTIKSATPKASAFSVFVDKSKCLFQTPTEPARLIGYTDIEYDTVHTTINLTFSGMSQAPSDT
ncbi:hypothetical protein BLNAU_20347 [Blattamonas nauphoetae]|uniref:Uncharacterized protein n=1 Tax=Blattamonas nauphoetae TaxID=2049346 RepID=A0ABQ9X278_9EUKA|nr:hypothetical protein BLNAU_20347 [Blattamonas nauphoetae]